MAIKSTHHNVLNILVEINDFTRLYVEELFWPASGRVMGLNPALPTEYATKTYLVKATTKTTEILS